tara:strand:- start:592 stop:795 length:204 start_codon:yes stop_codon:yes gene_type:complete
MYRDIENIAYEIEGQLNKSSLEDAAVEAVLYAMKQQIEDIIYNEGYDVDVDDVRDIISSDVFKDLNI